MNTYIALLRGINVGGHNKITMEELRLACRKVGWENVKTYINSGNVVFQTKTTDQKVLADNLMIQLQRYFKLLIPVLILEYSELTDMVSHNPFIIERNMNIDHLYLTLMKKEPEPGIRESIPHDQFLPDEFVIRGRAIYLFLPNGVTYANLQIPFFEKKFGTLTTTRNWKTIGKLMEMAMLL
ncbi:MAG TPA: DUF1697 domain-containing protein [Candidatus Cloacimonadota bacterium]|nr:DUF1697 domain-containing protein [Candidatus Cloacimonadota bacterium]HPT71007.1 DUF1697 domain-containing protein [Candidatus Cloacimonadota bacterium]